ncbi:MAG: hypothetical protein WBF66_03035, partial [Dehalococcoidia bacterium]
MNRQAGTATGTGGYGGIEQVIGGAGLDTLIGANAAATWHVTDNDAGDVGGAGVFDFWSVENLTGGTAADMFVFSDGALLTGGIAGQGEDDTIDFGAFTTPSVWNVTADDAGNLNESMPFSSIENLIGGSAADRYVFGDGQVLSGAIDGRGGSDAIDFSDYSTPNAWQITADNAGTVNGGIPFTSVENLTGGAAADQFTFADGVVLAGTADGRAGSDTLDLSAYGTANVWGISAPGAGTVDALGGFLAMENLVGGTDADDFVFANGAGVLGLVDGRSGYDTLDWTAYDVIHAVSVNRETLSATGTDGYAGIEQVIGGAGSDALTGANEGNTWHVTADDAGQISSVLLDFSGFENLVGGTEVDDFILVDGVLVTGVIDGGDGSDALDLSAYASANAWEVTSDNCGTVAAQRGSIEFGSVEFLIGGAAVDSFVFADGALLGEALDGGAGDDVLDFSAYTTPNVWTVDGPNGYIETQRGNFSFVSIENQIGGQTEFHGEFVDLAG